MITNSNSSFFYDPSQQYLFRRSYSITIGQVGKTPALQYSNFPLPGINYTVNPPSGLRVSFSVEKNSIGSANKSKVEIYNLATQSRQSIGKATVIRLNVGYNGLTDTLITGIVHPKGLASKRSGGDIITTMEIGDGESAIMLNRLDKAYPPGTTLATVLGDLGTAMSIPVDGSPVGVSAGISLGIPNITFGRGLSLTGTCRESLNMLLKNYGLTWSVQNGALSIIPLQAHHGATAIVVSSGVSANPYGPSSFSLRESTGLLGTPSTNGNFTEFTALLNPRLVPNALVQLKSENTALNKFYKIMSAHYEGDTHDSKWQVKCQCVPINAVQLQTSAQGFNYNPAVVA